ncbi:MAG TPA: carbamoyltransferase HypF [Polyangiales bacterium]|nr:carbamoyltransferase HypF [Polyangiales bacterium]
MRRVRYAIDVDGLAQGVGFRPFVHGLAHRLELDGSVCNAAGGVRIEIEGEASALSEFVSVLQRRAPFGELPRALTVLPAVPRGERGFHITPSDEHGPASVAIPADMATCRECIVELFAAENRRYLYPFISCTLCGPRATVIADVPYDRERTSMAAFVPCAACRVEYADPADRRFHAQAIACHACGPQLYLLDSGGERSANDRSANDREPLDELVDTIDRGGIAALKGIGGFHLICDAADDRAVRELRERKQRDKKPLAIMVVDAAHAARCCRLDLATRTALESAGRPIVLARARAGHALSAALAPGVDTLGVLLAYAPVHHLLLHRLGNRPLVVTSGNRSSEPIASNDAEAIAQLGSIADTIVSHDRAIIVRYEDSVVRVEQSAILPVRRARGYAPLPIELSFALAAPALAVGAHQKSAFAFGVQRRAILGPHFGDLDGYHALVGWSDAIAAFERIHRVRPERLACDLHPDYASSRYAHARAAAEADLELVEVQHHHAHMASCMADNALEGDVIGVCFDGTGLGSDGTLWGGELLVGGYAHCERAAHLATVALPGGDRAAREPWRAALSHARAAEASSVLDALQLRIDRRALQTATRMLETGLNAPLTSSIGRLFDAVAAIAGVLDVASYEGEAGLRLETLARRSHSRDAYPIVLAGTQPCVIECAPIICAVADDARRGVSPELIARRFHSAVIELVVQTCARLRELHRLERVVLSGGVFANAILSSELPQRLRDAGFVAFTHRAVPPNDGGLCLGQLAVAAHRPRTRRPNLEVS